MPYLLNGRRLSLDVPFQHGGVQYPANWLRLASPETRAGIGIVEVEDVEVDGRFYFGAGEDGALIPRDLDGLKEEALNTLASLTHNILSATDWMVIREVDAGTPVSSAIRAWRQSVRDASSLKKQGILQCVNVAELRELTDGEDFNSWPEQPSL